MRLHPRLDGNHKRIVEELRSHEGVSVQSLASMGNGVPDLLVGHQGRNTLWEVKDLCQPEGKRRLTPKEAKWHREWTGQVAVAYTSTQILHAIGWKPAGVRVTLEEAVR